jgi:2-amino-4-hydroxy-6-hydroxymethyldihydropteridine diphosphokinase
VERALGRHRPAGVANAPRTIDLDLLLVGDLIVDESGLQLPHPRLLQRPFVRVPLAAVARPGLRHPITGDRLDRAAPHPEVREAGGL